MTHKQEAFGLTTTKAPFYAQVQQLEEWLLDGRLDNVSPGEPQISEDDLQTFLQHENIEVCPECSN